VPAPVTFALLYLRVSGVPQVRNGVSLPLQREHCLRYAHEHGWRMAGMFEDVMSGCWGGSARLQPVVSVRSLAARARTQHHRGRGSN
jgi:hypothetical protein